MKKLLLVFSLLLFQSSMLLSQSGIITTIAGNGYNAPSGGFSGDGGQASIAELDGPGGVAIDSVGNIFVADRYNSVIRMIDSTGIISTFAGNHISGYSGDGGLATDAELSDPVEIMINDNGNFIISDEGNNSIRKINSAGIISTIVGNGVLGYTGDGGPATAAELNGPGWFDIDNSGNLYFADEFNDVVREVNTLGIITTIAGNRVSGYSGDGGLATAAEFEGIEGVGVDDSGNVFIPDDYNYVIRKVNTLGIVSTVVGNHHSGYSGDGGPASAAELNLPCDVKFDVLGNMYIADEENFEVRMVNTSGIIYTVAGNHIGGFSGDGGQATAAELSDLNSMSFDNYGNMYIADTYNDRVRKVTSEVITSVSKVITSTFHLPQPCPR